MLVLTTMKLGVPVRNDKHVKHCIKYIVNKFNTLGANTYYKTQIQNSAKKRC